MCSLKCEDFSSYEQTLFFLKTAHWYLFKIITFPLNLKIYKQAWKFHQELFWEKKDQLLLCPNDIHTFLLLITVFNMPKGLVT